MATIFENKFMSNFAKYCFLVKKHHEATYTKNWEKYTLINKMVWSLRKHKKHKKCFFCYVQNHLQQQIKFCLHWPSIGICFYSKK